MARRKGLGAGKGKGYKNIMGKDPAVHSQSAKGMKQPQRINESMMLNRFTKANAPKISSRLIETYNKTKNKNLLKNKGMAIERTLFKRETIIGSRKGHDGHNKPIILNFEIKETDLSTQAIYNGEWDLLYVGNTKLSVDGEKLTKYKHLSISGEIGKGFSMEEAGQIYDTLRNGLQDPDYSFKDKKAVKEILNIWEEHHLNDMNAGTITQQKALEKVGLQSAGNYDLAVAYLKKKKLYIDKGYRYGTKWLIKDLPDDIIDRLDNVIKKFR